MILSGTDIADFIKQRHYEQIRGRRPRPVMAIVQVASDGPKASYIRAKQAYGEDVGAIVDYHRLEPDINQKELLAFVQGLNLDPAVDGIVVQLPLPTGIDTAVILDSIDPAKDIDGLGVSAGYDSATAEGIMWLLGAYDIPIKGAKVAVIGQGRVVGTPVAAMLEATGAQVVRADITTPELTAVVAGVDIIVTATGQAGLISPDLVQDGMVIIDAGMGLVGDKLSGDVDPVLYDRDDLKITPTPGGVGPMTIAVLFEHLLRASHR